MKNPAVRTEEQSHICTIILDHPDKKNAVDRPTAEALHAAFEQFEANANLRVAVLWGANGTLCSGAERFAKGAVRHGQFDI
ncbi:enoyl-CoA hydratase-related protein [Marinobacter sp.]|uniref:enoyl-CoA hydratase-related protein n=1 Tax=Marinobacter sp. TaxID=50741 RepID=UPI003A8F3746